MRKSKLNIIIIMLIILIFSSLSFAEDNGNIYVIPIEGEINKATYNFVRDYIYMSKFI